MDGRPVARRRSPDRHADARLVRGDFYTAEHAKVAEAFAAFAATAIDKARYLTELQRAREHAETLLAVTQVLGRTLSLEETFETILDELQRVVPYDSSSIQVIQGNRLVIVGARGLEDLGGMFGVGFDLDDETNLDTQVVRSRRQQIFADVSQNPHFASREHGGGRIRGWICAPMIVGDRVIGVLSIDKFEPDFYTEELAELATAFAAQAAIAIENARLLETERAARQQAETLRAAAESLGSTLSMSEVFDLILSELRKVVPYRSASVQQLDGDELVIVGGHGFPDLDELLGHRYRLARTRRSCLGAGRAARDRHPLRPLPRATRSSRMSTSRDSIRRGWQFHC